MSTTHQLFTSEEQDLFIKLLKEWPNSESGNTEATYSVTPFITFYFLPKEEENKDVSLLLVDIHEEFEQLAGYPYPTISPSRMLRRGLRLVVQCRFSCAATNASGVCSTTATANG